MDLLKRKITLVPRSLSVRFEDQEITMSYKSIDDASNKILGDTHIVFKPSSQLMQAFKEELDTAISKSEKI